MANRTEPRLTAAEVRRALDDPRTLCARLGLSRGARKQRGGLMILCPWHEEKTPSCSVRGGHDGTVVAHCYGCGASGDALSLVAVAHGLDVRRDFPEVLQEAARVAGLQAGRGETRQEAAGRAAATGPALAKVGVRSSSPRARHLVLVPGLPLAPAPTSAAAPALDDATFAAISEVLLHAGSLDGGALTDDVARYLADRKLLDLARAEGWAALPAPGPTQAAWVRMLVDVFGAKAMEASGLLWKRGRGHTFAHPGHRLVIPWRAPGGAVQTLQRRRIDGGSEKKYVFPAGRAARDMYGVDQVRAGSVLAIVEGAADVLALRWLLARDGIEASVVGLAGAQRWDAAWARYAGKQAILGLDADTAGHLAVGGIAHDLVLSGVEHLERWKPRSGKDWADTLRAER
ncbi:CHC2 zinc finger domain-containing protein [Chondromyces apiculatus]|nr:CHC2 zinc finger domain-containing protein [Chondromyces apiculatus]